MDERYTIVEQPEEDTRWGLGECVVRIDQGDYLQERGGYDWGRSTHGRATIYANPAAARAAADRLGVGRLVRAFEPAW